MKKAEILSRLPIVFALSREEAAASIGISVGTFNELVEQGRMPRATLIGKRKVWDTDELRLAFKALPKDGEEVEDQSWADVA